MTMKHSVTSERYPTWATIWAAIRIVSHSEESGIPQEVATAMGAVTGEKTSKTVQMVGPGVNRDTTWVINQK